MVCFAVLGLHGRRWARYVNAGLAGCLFLSALLLPRLVAATLVNDILVAGGVLLFAIMPEPSATSRCHGAEAARGPQDAVRRDLRRLPASAPALTALAGEVASKKRIPAMPAAPDPSKMPSFAWSRSCPSPG